MSYGALGGLGRLPALEVVPCHYSALPRLFAARRLPGDVVLVQVVAAGRARALQPRRRRRLPGRRAGARARRDRRGQRPLPGHGRRVDRVGSARRGRAHLAAAAGGAGGRAGRDRAADRGARRRRSSPTATRSSSASARCRRRSFGASTGHRDLGVHSGMVSDGDPRPDRGGRRHNARKRVTGRQRHRRGARQRSGCSTRSHGREDIVFRPASATRTRRRCWPDVALAGGDQQRGRDRPHRPGQLGGGRRAADRRRRRPGRLPARGRAQADHRAAGQADRARALSGPVSTARSDVDWVVTEHGARSLAGLSDTAAVEGAARARRARRWRREHKGPGPLCFAACCSRSWAWRSS